MSFFRCGTVILAAFFIALAIHVAVIGDWPGSPGTARGSTNFIFSSDLKTGDRGYAVRSLQMFLNSVSGTEVAVTGPGSSGHETDYFGPATRAGVVRFQEKYSLEILSPLGLLKGTGFVGAGTRKKLNLLIEGTSRATLPSSPSVTGSSSSSVLTGDLGVISSGVLAKSKELFVAFPSSYSGFPGEEIALTGSGFSDKNTIHFGDVYGLGGLPSSGDGTSITFAVPQNIPPGRYDLWVNNGQKDSNKTFFVVAKPNVSSPTITRVSPATGSYGQEVTILGSGFEPQGNEILTSYGIIHNVSSSDRVTLTFRVLPFPDLPWGMAASLNREIKWPMAFYVVNGNGVTKDGAMFTLVVNQK